MTKINKEYTLQNFKASASNTSQFLEGKGYKIPQTTLLHALSVFVGEKNWNTLQALFKNQLEQQTNINVPVDVPKMIEQILEDVDSDEISALNMIKYKREADFTLSFIKNRLEVLSDEFFIHWEKSKYIRDYIDVANINIHQSDKQKLEYDICLQLLNKFEYFSNKIIDDNSYFSKKYNNQQIDRAMLSEQSIYLNTLVSTSKLNETRMNILFNFNIFCLNEIKNDFFKEIQFYVSTDKNSKQLLNHSIHVFCPNEYKKESIDQFLRKVLENFQY